MAKSRSKKKCRIARVRAHFPDPARKTTKKQLVLYVAQAIHYATNRAFGDGRTHWADYSVESRQLYLACARQVLRTVRRHRCAL